MSSVMFMHMTLQIGIGIESTLINLQMYCCDFVDYAYMNLYKYNYSITWESNFKMYDKM